MLVVMSDFTLLEAVSNQSSKTHTGQEGGGGGGTWEASSGRMASQLVLDQLGARGRVAEPRGGKGNHKGDMVGACGGEGGVPCAKGREQRGVGEGEVEDPGSPCVGEGEVCINSWLVKKRETAT